MLYNKFLLIVVIVLMLLPSIIIANDYQYEQPYGNQSSTGDGSLGAILVMEVSINSDHTITARISKQDRSSFSSNGTMYLQKDHYGESSSYNIASTTVYNGSSTITLKSSKKLDGINTNWSNNLLKIYARLELNNGQYTWCGPVTIRRFVQTGGLCVNITPSELRSAGAKWRVVINETTKSMWYESGYILSGLNTGRVKIQLSNIQNWNKPVDAVVTINSNRTTYYTALYISSLPDSPSFVNASDDEYDKIKLSWVSVSGVNQYEIYRSTTYDINDAIKIDTVYGNSYTDYSVVDCKTYYYWIRAKSYFGVSTFSQSALGKTSFHVNTSTSNQLINSEGGSTCIYVNAPNGCSWKVLLADSGVLPEQTEGYGGDKICFTILPNYQQSKRTLMIKIRFTCNNTHIEKEFIIIQNACEYYLSPGSFECDSASSVQKLRVFSSEGCNWSVSSKPEWVTIDNITQEYVNFTIHENPSAFVRYGTIVITGSNGYRENGIITQKASPLPPPIILNSDLPYSNYSNNCIKTSDALICRSYSLKLTGKGVAGAKVILFDNGIPIPDIHAIVNSNQSFMFEDIILSDDYHEIFVKQITQEKESLRSNSLVVVIDSVSPDPVQQLRLEPDDDTGRYSNDSITNKTNQLTITGTGENQSTIRLYDNGKILFSDEPCVVTDNHFSMDIALYDEGTHLLTARQEDAAGNISIESEPLTIVIDTVGPEIEDIKPVNNSFIDHINFFEGSASDSTSLSEITLQLTDGELYLQTDFSRPFVKYPAWLPLEIQNNYSINVSGVNFRENVSYTVTHRVVDIAGNKTQVQSCFIMGVERKETIFDQCNIADTFLIMGNQLKVTGKLFEFDQDEKKGIYSAAITFILTSPDNINYTTNAILTSLGGIFNYTFDRCELTVGGIWTLSIIFPGSDKYKPAKNVDLSFTVRKLSPTIDIRSSDYSVMPGQNITITGSLKTLIADCQLKLENIPISLKLNSEETIITCDNDGHFAYTATTPQNITRLYLQASISEKDLFQASQSKEIIVEVQEFLGHAIVIQNHQNDDPNDDSSFFKLSKFIDFCFRKRGLTDIIHIGSIVPNGTNSMKPSKGNLESAIKEFKQSPKLYLIFIGHAGDNEMMLSGESFTSEALALLLERYNIQSSILIFGTCHSESFIKGLKNDHRIIIASAGKNEDSQRGIRDTLDVRMGDFFVASFFRSVLHGKNIKECFDHAEFQTKRWTASKNQPFVHDDSSQHPVFYGNKEFYTNKYIGVSSEIIGSQILEVSDVIILNQDTSTAILTAHVNNDRYIDKMWIDIKKPGELQANKMARVFGKQQYDEFIFDAERQFSSAGIYQVFFVSEDNRDNTRFISSMKDAILIKKTDDTNQSPNNFSLFYPKSGDEIATTDWFHWEKAVDPDNDPVIYSLYISKENSDFSESLCVKGISDNRYHLSKEQALDDQTLYFWKIDAIDQFGAIKESAVLTFTTNNTNHFAAAMLELEIHDFIRKEDFPIAQYASITICTKNQQCFQGSYGYNVLRPNIEYTLIINVKGYHQQIKKILPQSSEEILESFNLIPSFAPSDLITSLRYFVGYEEPKRQNFIRTDICKDDEIKINDLKCIFMLQSETPETISFTEVSEICRKK